MKNSSSTGKINSNKFLSFQVNPDNSFSKLNPCFALFKFKLVSF